MKKMNTLKVMVMKRFSLTFSAIVMSAFTLFANNTTNNVVDVIVNSPNHTTLEAAVIAAQLDDDLSGAGPFTVFAPTDAAFAALPVRTVDALLQDPTGELAQILLYHVVNASALSTSLSNGQKIATLNGKEVTVTITDGKVYINNAMVTVADIAADNGVVHVIDAVLLPPTVTVVDVIVNSPNHTTLEAAVIAAQLDDDLSGAGPFTVFAPTDAAFAALPAGTVDALLQDPTGELAQILLYHVVNASALSTSLSNGQKIVTLNGKEVTVTITEGKVYINNAMVTVADIAADNGVVHVIDAVLLPPTVTVVDVIVNSPNHTTLEAAVIAAQLDDDLSGNRPFTVFAPTDAAFAALPAGTVDALLQDPTGELAQILLYHVVNASALSSSLTNGQKIATLNGKEITVTITDGKVYINNAMVTVADIKADNGVVHVIDAVLLPPTATAISTAKSKLFEVTTRGDNMQVKFAESLGNNASISIVDINGKATYNQTINAEENSIDINLAVYSKGIYLIRLANNGMSEVQKFIKK